MTTLMETLTMPHTNTYSKLVQKQRAFFNTGKTRSIDFRKKQLNTLIAALEKHTKNLQDALYADLHKSAFEAYTAEIGITIADTKFALKNIDSWSKPKRVHTPLFFIPGKSELVYEPYGVSLVISPWNYPIKNLIGPVLGSMAAGNTLILKPSEISAQTSIATAHMMKEFFEEEYVSVVEGGAKETALLLEEKMDHIFFTGGTEIGKIIYQAAAKNLTPCTLELGGKSPSIVDKDVDIDIAAKRLVWGKFYNTGQTCVAPDYLFVHKDIKAKFIEKLIFYTKEFFGDNPKNSNDLGRIISSKHFNRIKGLISGKVLLGGEMDEQEKYIAPTIIDDVKGNDPIMQQEIFGPVLPIMDFTDVKEVVNFINEREKPLALYVFSYNSGFVNTIIKNTSSGGVCVNETIMHMVTPHLPFGGVGSSGLGGSYNGFYGFETFSHKKPVMKKSFWMDLKMKYPPYTEGRQNFIKFAIKKLI